MKNWLWNSRFVKKHRFLSTFSAREKATIRVMHRLNPVANFWSEYFTVYFDTLSDLKFRLDRPWKFLSICNTRVKFPYMSDHYLLWISKLNLDYNTDVQSRPDFDFFGDDKIRSTSPWDLNALILLIDCFVLWTRLPSLNKS